MKGRALAIAVLLASLAPSDAQVQQPAAPEPILRLTIDPPRVVVGQKTSLVINVLAPNYMTAPPVLPDFQVRNAVTRQLRSINQSEREQGTTFAGVRFEFAIYPQEPGSYAIPDQKVTVKYAAEPPATREATIALPRLEFQAFIPDAAAGLHPFLAATRLTVEQAVQRSSEQLKVGDSVTRTVTVKAEGVPAMLLPPVTFASADGLALYPSQPSLQDHTDARTDVLSATRIDQATYMLQRPGSYTLPAIEIGWWNAGSQKIERARVDSIALEVADNPAAGAAATPTTPQASRWNWRTLLDRVLDHLPLIVLAIAALISAGWAFPRATRIVAARYRQRRAAWLGSEAHAFARLRAAARARNASGTYFALLDWLARCALLGPAPMVETLKRAAQDPVLDAEIAAIERRLFDAQPAAGDWSPRRMVRRIAVARRRLRKPALLAGAPATLPQGLNPATARPPIGRQRPVAR